MLSSPTVAPVIDYEPPAHPVPGPPQPAPARRRRCAPPRVEPSRGRRPVDPPPALRTAAVFADLALRRVLEVIDRRRPAAQLYPLLTAGLVDSVRPVRAPTFPRADTAALQRVRVQAVGAGDPLAVVEVFGTYRRGRRVHALAARVQRIEPSTGSGWRIVALHIG